MALEALFRSADRHWNSHRDFVHFATDEMQAASARVVIYSSCRIR